MYSAIRAILISAIAVALLMSCEQQAPESLPPDSVLIELLCDLHQAEASMTRVATVKQDSISDILRERIARSHGITAEQMDTWLELLQKSPDHLITVYDSVIARLEKSVPKQ